MIRGRAKKDNRTKSLIKRLMPGDIAVIFHQDLDEVAAVHLADRKVKAVINGAQSISGKYPNYGPKFFLMQAFQLLTILGKKLLNA